MKTVPYVDIERFMGDWYVIANIPTFIEKRSTNAIESYYLNKKGEIETTFTFYQDDPCLLYTSPSPRDATLSRMPSSA